MDGERSVLVPVCESSVVAEDGTTRVQHCVEGYQCVVDNLKNGKEGGWEGRENGRRWGEWEREWREEQREEKVKLWWRYIGEAAWIPGLDINLYTWHAIIII